MSLSSRGSTHEVLLARGLVSLARGTARGLISLARGTARGLISLARGTARFDRARLAHARSRPLALPALLASLLSLTGCESVAPSAPPKIASQAATQTFGAKPTLAGDPLEVDQVLLAPKTYLQQTIKCAGTVSRVCEAAGCWLELRADSGGPGLRVPMAGHTFSVPQSIVGKNAIVEGKLSARELSDAELAHLRGEGLAATGPLFLAATSVFVPSEQRAQSRVVPSEHRERSRFR